MFDHQLDQSQDRDYLQKCFLIFAFLPHLLIGGFGYDIPGLILSLMISMIAVAASIYSWRPGRDIRYLVMAFLVAALPVFMILLLYIFLYFFGHGL